MKLRKKRSTTSAHAPIILTFIAQAIRGHWKVENKAHWVLEVIYSEDESCTRRVKMRQKILS